MESHPDRPAGLSLNTLLVRLVWTCMGPLLCLAAYLAFADVQEVQRQREARARAMVAALTASIDQDLAARIGALQMLAASPLADEASQRGRFYQEAQGFLRSFGSHVVLAAPDLQMLFNTRVPFGQALPRLPLPAGRAATPIAFATGRAAIGDVFMGPISHQPMAAIAIPVLRDGQALAVLLSTFETRQFQKHLDAVVLPQDQGLILRDSSGTEIARRLPREGKADAPVDAEGRFSAPLAGTPWSVTLEIPREAYRAPLLRAAGLLAAAILAATAAGLVGGTLAGRRLSRAVTALAGPAGADDQRARIVEIVAVRQLLDAAALRQEASAATMRLSEQRFRRLFQDSPLALALIGKDGNIVDLNARFIQLFGHTPDDIRTVGDWWSLAYQDQEQRGHAAQVWGGIEAGREARQPLPVEAIERRVRCKDGSIREVLLSGLLVGDEFLCTFVDITDRKQALNRQREHLERLELLDQLTTAIGERHDLKSIYPVVLRRLEERMPVDFSCMLGFDGAGQRLGVLTLGAASAQRAVQTALGEGQAVDLDAADQASCMRGEVIYEPDAADTASARFSFSGRMADCGLRSLVLVPVCSDQGLVGALLVARTEAQAFSSGDSEFLRQLCAHLGLATQQARLHDALQGAYDELRQTQQAVMQQERLRALGQMASGVAHDINNAISPVLLYTETLLEHEADLSARTRKYLQTIARSIDDVAATVARLRQFYRPHEPGLKPVLVSLPPLAEQVLDLTRARWHDMPMQRGLVVEARADIAADLPAVMGIESEIREALINLIFNAVDAMPEGGTLILRLRPGEAGTVEVSVIDTGMGMDEGTRQRCMEPFFTTKGERGTGLGLSMVYGIAQRHGADLDIDSAPGEGTRVTLVFPAAPVAAPTGTVAAAAARMRPLDLLLVDDDPVVLASLRDSLVMEGHRVSTADGGKAGIDAFESALRSGTPYDAVITDLGMPYVDGRQVARSIKERSSATPVILLTGWGQRLVADGEIPLHVDRVLGKPPKLRELREVLSAVAGPGHD